MKRLMMYALFVVSLCGVADVVCEQAGEFKYSRLTQKEQEQFIELGVRTVLTTAEDVQQIRADIGKLSTLSGILSHFASTKNALCYLGCVLSLLGGGLLSLDSSYEKSDDNLTKLNAKGQTALGLVGAGIAWASFVHFTFKYEFEL